MYVTSVNMVGMRRKMKRRKQLLLSFNQSFIFVCSSFVCIHVCIYVCKVISDIVYKCFFVPLFFMCACALFVLCPFYFLKRIVLLVFIVLSCLVL